MTENQVRQQMVDQIRALLALWPDIDTDLRLTQRFNRGAGDGLLVTPLTQVNHQLDCDDIGFLAPGSVAADWQTRLHESLPTTQAVLSCAPDYTAALATLPQPASTQFPVSLRPMQSLLGQAINRVAVNTSPSVQIDSIRQSLTDGSGACLLIDNGMVVTGQSPADAAQKAVQFERFARLHYRHLRLDAGKQH